MLYGVDVDEWVWRPDVRLLVGLIERLPYEPRSMYPVSYTHLTLPTNREV